MVLMQRGVGPCSFGITTRLPLYVSVATNKQKHSRKKSVCWGEASWLQGHSQRAPYIHTFSPLSLETLQPDERQGPTQGCNEPLFLLLTNLLILFQFVTNYLIYFHPYLLISPQTRYAVALWQQTFLNKYQKNNTQSIYLWDACYNFQCKISPLKGYLQCLSQFLNRFLTT